MPGGFPVDNVRFWTNGVWPWTLLGVSVAGLWSVARRRPDWTKALVLSFGIMALSTAVTAALVFPDIRRIVVIAALLVGLIELGLACVITAAWPPKTGLAGLTLATALLGTLMPLAQRAERSTTNSLDQGCPWAELISTGTPPDSLSPSASASDRVTVLPSANTVVAKLNGLRLVIEPLLTFESTSASGCWSILSQHGQDRSRALGRLTKVAPRSGELEPALLFGGPDDWLSVADQGEIEITAYCRIPTPIYSHLNSFCIMTISGHKDLQLEFSPCGSMRFEPLPADYPIGRPARFAYCNADGEFRVVEASSGEKGPFVALAEGRMERDVRLSIGIVDGGRRIATVHLDDWAVQLSTALSPTAGWGVPVNAIEFQRMGDAKQNAVTIWIALAATSVGRGWDTVGHSAGTYRNRIVVDVAD
jgi:hypothetical protein